MFDYVSDLYPNKILLLIMEKNNKNLNKNVKQENIP